MNVNTASLAKYYFTEDVVWLMFLRVRGASYRDISCPGEAAASQPLPVFVFG